MGKTLLQKEAAELWRKEQRHIERQEESRSMLYGIYKTLRDIGDTGDEILDSLRDNLSIISEQAAQRVNELNDLRGYDYFKRTFY